MIHLIYRCMLATLLATLALPAIPAPLATEHPGDQGLAEHPAVLFHSDFSSGLAGWSRYSEDPTRLRVIATDAVSGTRALRMDVDLERLERTPNLSTFAEFRLHQPVDTLYWRFHARLVGDSAVPHHWVRVRGESPGFHMGGRAGQRPAGDEGFSVALDLSDGGDLFFYVYWQEMRSWVCNDGSTDPDCRGRQGGAQPRNPYYGNHFHPAGQPGVPRDAWFCVEMAVEANTPGEHDGALTLWLNDTQIGEYRTGMPRGRWLRQHFYTQGRYFRDEQAFEGFNFRSRPEVQLTRVTLDAYYQLDTLLRKQRRGLTVPQRQSIEYDAVVVATERIGCHAPGTAANAAARQSPSPVPPTPPVTQP